MTQISSKSPIAPDTGLSLEPTFAGRFLHACPIFGGKVIDEFDDEIIHCRCYESADFLEVQDHRAVLDAKRKRAKGLR